MSAARPVWLPKSAPASVVPAALPSASVSYLPFVEPEVPLYPCEAHIRGGVVGDALATIIVCLLVILGTGYLSHDLGDEVTLYSVTLTLTGLGAFVWLVRAVHVIVQNEA